MFVHVYSAIYNEAFPKTRVKMKYYHRKPWLTEVLKNSIRQKNKLFKLSKKYPVTDSIGKYKTYRSTLNKLLKRWENCITKNFSVDIETICKRHGDSRFQDSRFKIALLLPIKHKIIYITVKSTWNVNTSTNTAMHYHGSKGSWKSCRIYGLLVCYTYSKYISTGVQRVQQNKKKHKMTLPVIMYQQHMRYMTSTLFN